MAEEKVDKNEDSESDVRRLEEMYQVKEEIMKETIQKLRTRIDCLEK